MDGSQKRVALIAEVTRGTTSATPAFLTVRDIRTTGGKQQPRTRSPERSATRQSLTTYKGLVTIPKQIEMPLAYDDALNVLLASVLQTAWASNVAKLQSTVAGMTLEHYPGMTEKSLHDIVEQAKDRWDLKDALVIHRVGPLMPQDQIVLVAVTSAHRGEAFAACEFIMDYLKTLAPFWKKEDTPEGARWVDARVSDDQAMARWAKK